MRGLCTKSTDSIDTEPSHQVFVHWSDYRTHLTFIKSIMRVDQDQEVNGGAYRRVVADPCHNGQWRGQQGAPLKRTTEHDHYVLSYCKMGPSSYGPGCIECVFHHRHMEDVCVIPVQEDCPVKRFITWGVTSLIEEGDGRRWRWRWMTQFIPPIT